MHFIVLSSSRGTTFQAIIDALKLGTLKAECAGLVADRADRGCVEKAKAAGIPYEVIKEDPKGDRSAFERGVDIAIRQLFSCHAEPLDSARDKLREAETKEGPQTKQIVAAMGWMWILSPDFISQWKNRIINVHPALLPKFGGEGMYGLHVHEAVLRSGDKESGVTFHLMDNGIDTGKILLQKRCKVEQDDTPEILQKRVQELEKEWYPKVLQMVHGGGDSPLRLM